MGDRGIREAEGGKREAGNGDKVERGARFRSAGSRGAGTGCRWAYTLLPGARRRERVCYCICACVLCA